MKKAVFFDRDGVINKPVYNNLYEEYGPPYKPEDFELYPGVIEALKLAEEAGYYLFIVSNQPDYAKGKCSYEDLLAVHKRFDVLLKENGIKFTDYYYCYHHPEGITKGYSGECACRKPNPFFLKKAERDYEIDLSKSWMIGDRETDIIFGINGGVKTLFIKSEDNKSGLMNVKADSAGSLLDE